MPQVRSRLTAEWGLFRALPRPARFLFGASTIYAFAAPVISVFISAYIMRNSHDVVKVMAFQLASYTAVPLELAYSPILLQALDRVSLREEGGAYAYFYGHELGLYAGRLIGACAFIWVARCVSDWVALRYVLAAAAAVQLLSLPITQGILKRMRAEG